MKHTKELIVLRSFAITVGLGIVALLSYSFTTGTSLHKKLTTLDVERINIVEADGTVKMVITNAQHFPTKGDVINKTTYHERKKRAGMLFFTEDGKECGGFIYDGQKTNKGHNAGLSLTFDQYDGDQVVQLIATDIAKNGRRKKSSRLVFNDQGDHSTNALSTKLWAELDAIKDPKERSKKYQEYKKKGLLMTHTPRVALGSFTSNKGLFLFDDNGKPKAKFGIDNNNEVKLEIYDEQGNVINSWPSKQ